MMNIRNIFKKHQQPTHRELLLKEYDDINRQYEQVTKIQKWLNGYTYENPSFNPTFFRDFFSRVRNLPFEDIPAEANATFCYFDAKKKEFGAICLSYEEVSAEYQRLYAIHRSMSTFEDMVNPNQTGNPYLQSIYWARQVSRTLRIYLDSKEKALKERLDTLMLELFPA